MTRKFFFYENPKNKVFRHAKTPEKPQKFKNVLQKNFLNDPICFMKMLWSNCANCYLKKKYCVRTGFVVVWYTSIYCKSSINLISIPSGQRHSKWGSPQSCWGPLELRDLYCAIQCSGRLKKVLIKALQKILTNLNALSFHFYRTLSRSCYISSHNPPLLIFQSKHFFFILMFFCPDPPWFYRIYLLNAWYMYWGKIKLIFIVKSKGLKHMFWRLLIPSCNISTFDTR